MKQLVCALAAVLALAACSSATSKSKAKPKTATPAACTMTTPAPKVAKVAGNAHDYTLTSSLDGARIRFHWFPIATSAPVILMGPGWGEAGAEEKGGTGLFGDSPVTSLKKAKGQPRKDALTRIESTPVWGVLIMKAVVAPLEAPSLRNPRAVGMTPQEQRGSGTPIREARVTLLRSG